jgi:hypothetical protein
LTFPSVISLNKHEKVFKLKARERSININCKEIKFNKQKLILENDRQIKIFTRAVWTLAFQGVPPKIR